MIGNSIAGFLGTGVAAATSSYESIATYTGSGTWTFSSIPQTYKHLQLRYSFTTTTTGGYLALQFNGDTGTNYSDHFMSGNGTGTNASGTASSASMIIAGYKNGWIGTYPNVGVIDILDYSSTTKNKTVRGIYGSNDNSTSTSTSAIELNSGCWFNTSAITSIASTTTNSSANVSWALYGIKGA